MDDILLPVGGTLIRSSLSIIESFWNGKSERTKKAYRDDILRVAGWAGFEGDINGFAEVFLANGPGAAYKLANDFKAYGLVRGWSPSYVNNHLAALRSLVKFARRVERVPWALDIEDVKVEVYRDTRGPGFDGLVALVEAARTGKNAWVAARDEALIRLFATTALRLHEVVSLDLQHVDLVGQRLFVKRKKKSERVFVTFPEGAAIAIRAWLVVRGVEPGPLFTSHAVGRRRPDGRLAESSVWAIVKALGERVHLRVGTARPHGIRHAAITKVLDETDGNIRAAQQFAGHANPSVTTKYDDNREDVAGQMATKVDEAIAAHLVTRDKK